jgi:hypothetical protein
MAKDTSSKPAEPPKPVHIGGETLADRILPHIKKILVGVIVLAVVLFVIFGIRAFKHRKEENRTAKLAEVMSVARRPVGPAAPAMPGMPPEPPGPRFATVKERADAVLDAMTKAGTDGGPSFRGAVLLDAGKIDEAIAEYRKGEKLAGIDGVMAREGLGVALEAKAGSLDKSDAAGRQKLLEEALAVYMTMQPDEAGPRRAYALYHQGRLQQKLEKKAEAKASYEKAKELAGSTDLPALIEQRLASL